MLLIREIQRGSALGITQSPRFSPANNFLNDFLAARPSVTPFHAVNQREQQFVCNLSGGSMGKEACAPAQSMSYEEVHREHRARVLRLCRLLLSDADEANDVSQEIFVKLFREYSIRHDEIPWGAWLYRVTVNACRDRRRSLWWRRWRGDAQSFDEADLRDRSPGPEQRALGEEKQRAIWNAFRALSARQREVFALRYLEGCSTDETAEALGVSSGTVKRHLFRAIEHMRLNLRGLS